MNVEHASWRSRAGWLGMVALVLFSGALVQAQDAPRPPRHPRPPMPPSAFWLGIECFPADDTLRTQLGLPEGTGLVVGHVIPEGPAAKAGIESHDVLLKAGDRELREIRDLVEAVDAAQENELALEVVRAGERLTLTVQPARREVPDHPRGGLGRLMLPDQRSVEEFMDRFGIEFDGLDMERPFNLRIARPWVMLDGALPEDMSVTIEKKGKEPARLTVRKGEEVWEVTEDELAELPEEVRRKIEPMLGPLAALPAEARRELGRLRERGEADATELKRRLDAERKRAVERESERVEDAIRHLRRRAAERADEFERLKDRINHETEQLRNELERLGRRLEELRSTGVEIEGEVEIKPEEKAPAEEAETGPEL